MEQETKERMNGLVNISKVKELKKLKRSISNELIKEGFDDDDVYDYVDKLW